MARTLLGLRNVPEARRARERLAKVRTGDVKGLWEAARRFAERVRPLVAAHEAETRGYVPLFIDATGIEVDGQLCSGGGRVALNRRTLLDWTAGMVPEGTPAWLRANNALLQAASGPGLRGARLGLLGQPDHRGGEAVAGSGAARRASQRGLTGHRRGGGCDLRDAPPGRLGHRAALRGGAAMRGQRPGSSGSAPHGDPGLARRPAAGRTGAPAPRQAGSEERLQGAGPTDPVPLAGRPQWKQNLSVTLASSG